MRFVKWLRLLYPEITYVESNWENKKLGEYKHGYTGLFIHVTVNVNPFVSWISGGLIVSGDSFINIFSASRSALSVK